MSETPWKYAVVVGASSGIGAAIARRLAAGGVRVALVARRAAEMEGLAAQLPNGTVAGVYPHDVTQYECVPALIQAIAAELGGMDLLVYSAGVMPLIAPDEYNFAVDRQVIEVNLLGAMAWINEAAVRFGRARGGAIVGVSSVAGDRGRKAMPAYAASKAGLDTYLESIRNRLGACGVRVLTAKPGPVDTPLSAGVDGRPLLISAETAAEQILRAARRGGVVYIPGVWKPIMFAIRNVPSALFRRMNV